MSCQCLPHSRALWSQENEGNRERKKPKKKYHNLVYLSPVSFIYSRGIFDSCKPSLVDSTFFEYHLIFTRAL